MLGGRRGRDENDEPCAMVESCATTYICVEVDIVLHSDCMAWAVDTIEYEKLRLPRGILFNLMSCVPSMLTSNVQSNCRLVSPRHTLSMQWIWRLGPNSRISFAVGSHQNTRNLIEQTPNPYRGGSARVKSSPTKRCRQSETVKCFTSRLRISGSKPMPAEALRREVLKRTGSKSHRGEKECQPG